ncbi:MAG: S-layer homology domain-containing protein, partial [Clostridia bacterium]|nr:S-layer homology domain-containing protein [Clostridia bacterium]
MGFKRLLCGVICIAILTASLMVSAADFSDIKGHWAETYVKAMVDKCYIKGYTDGTFKPDKTITNTEALILLSRMLGVDDEDYKVIVDAALEANSSVLSKYSTDYKEEMAYLLYRGVIDKDDLDTYISSANKNKTLLRYQCAILLTKLLGAEEEVKNSVFISSSYSDTAQIPSDARPYVEYVREAKIMEGMGADSYGDPIFGPNQSVTRGQMAKMLSSLIDVLDIKLVSGSVSAVDTFAETVKVSNKEYTVEDDTIIKLDGKDADFDDIKEKMEVQIIIVKDKVSMISASKGEVKDEPIRGIISSVSSGATGRTIIIADPEKTSNKTTYDVSDDVVVVIQKAEDLYSKLKSNQYVELTVEKDVVTRIEVLDKNMTVAGTLVSKDITSTDSLVTVADVKGNETVYVCEDGVEVVRNGKTVKLSDLIAGDSVSLKLTYHKVTKISAESKSQSSSGIIKSITHTESGSYLEIKEKNDTTKYSIASDAIIKVDGSDATVFDLRPGSAINFRS